MRARSSAQPGLAAQHLAATREAFDSVAPDYDGDRGNNAAIQDMRRELWRWLDQFFPVSSRLIDIGCGTGLDAVRMAQRGHQVTAIDWSPQMVARTLERTIAQRVSEQVKPLTLGAHELHRLEGAGTYDGAYSDLGALNCVPDLGPVARECARLLRPGGYLVFTVIGRICPWEIGYYLLLRRWGRVRIRFSAGMVPVSLNKRCVWTRYYTPREFFAAFAHHFELTHQRGIALFAPPPYLISVRERHRAAYDRLWRLDHAVAGWPVLRAMGDHFMIILRRR